MFPGIARLFKLRRDPSLSIAIKKTLNCLYGKLAETRKIYLSWKRGRMPENAEYRAGDFYVPKEIPTAHTCFAVAGAVTGGCRKALYDAMMTDPGAIVAVHTDGIVSRRELPLRLGGALGEWEAIPTESTVLIGAGVYMNRIDGEEREAIRGFQAKDALFPQLKELDGTLAGIECLHGVTLCEASKRDYVLLNQLLTWKKYLSVNMDDGRCWPRDWQSFREAFTNAQESTPFVIATRDVMRQARTKAMLSKSIAKKHLKRNL